MLHIREVQKKEVRYVPRTIYGVFRYYSTTKLCNLFKILTNVIIFHFQETHLLALGPGLGKPHKTSKKTLPKNNTCVLVTGANELEDISGSVYMESGSVISSIVNNQSSNDIISSKNATKYPNISHHLTHKDEAQTDLQNNSTQYKNVVTNKNTANASNSTTLDSNKLQPGVIVNKMLGKVVNILF